MTTLPIAVTTLRNATLPSGDVVDVAIADGVVTAVTPASGSPVGRDGELDLSGHVLLTAPAEPHGHLDKALSHEAIRPPMGDLGLAIASWRTYAATMSEADIRDRARRQVLRMLAMGTTAIRTHVDVLLSDDPLRGVRALVAVRDELAGLVDLELVALAGPDVPDADVEAALDAGVDLVGGAPHLATDPLADLGRLLAVAARRGVGVDLHTDESLHGPVTLGAFADVVRDWDVTVSAGHCVRLGTLDRTERDDVVARVRAADIGIIANPITNLYLQAWDAEDEVAPARGITAARTLLDAGVRFAAGADNVRDPFNPLGRSDALETAMLLVTAAHLTIEEAWHAVSDGARDVLALPVAGARVGAEASFLAIRGTSLPDVVANAPLDRIVLHRGRLVARSATTTEIAPATATDAPASAPHHARPLTESR